MRATDIGNLCTARGLSRPQLAHALRTTAWQRHHVRLPADVSLLRMIREWNAGRRGLSDFYAGLLREVFGVPFVIGKPGLDEEPEDDAEAGEQRTELVTRISRTLAVVDAGLVQLLEDQTAAFRVLDRRLGAAHLLAQTEAHLEQMIDLLTYSLPGGLRTTLAAAAAEGAALAGWQALDLGDPDRAWRLHETARHAARDSDNPAVLAHVTAQQAYALLDLDRPADAAALIGHARTSADQVPPLLRAWLSAAHAEALAAAGDETAVRHALDQAATTLPAEGADPDLPFVFLDPVHLARWHGHSLARLGATEAVDHLTRALADLDPTFTRAAAGLHVDLALAYAQRGEHSAARAEAKAAEQLAEQTASRRQRRRINRLLASGHPTH